MIDLVCRFFDPHQAASENIFSEEFNQSLKDDGALNTYAESLVWRLRGVHAMVRLV